MSNITTNNRTPNIITFAFSFILRLLEMLKAHWTGAD